jgi:CubicO group peptidase (beta-lactamase class C family)
MEIIDDSQVSCSAPIRALIGSAVLLFASACVGACTADGGEDSEARDAGSSTSVDCEAIWQRPGHGTTFYENNPTYVDPIDDSASWTFSTPEEQGMTSAPLAAAASTLSALPYLSSFLVLRHDAVVYEEYFNGSKVDDSNNVHSASKSILAAVAGIAVGKGHIAKGDALSDLLPGYFDTIGDPAKRAISVENLLTMTAGFAWEEDTSESELEGEADWVQAILELPLSDAPGSTFNYSTSQSHLLSAVISEASGTSLCDYAHTNLLGPLGITAEHWGRDPQGYFSGGYNLYLTPRELAKFGLLFLHKGRWNGQELVPESWVADSVLWQQDTGDGWGYGYQWWLTQMAGHDVQVAWGFGGQLVYVIPSLDLVAVMTTNTKDFSIDFDGAAIVEDYVIQAVSSL